MEKIVLRNKYNEFLKDIDTQDGNIEFTDDKKEAKTYNTEWFATVESEYVSYHFNELGDKVLTLTPCIIYDRNE